MKKKRFFIALTIFWVAVFLMTAINGASLFADNSRGMSSVSALTFRNSNADKETPDNHAKCSHRLIVELEPLPLAKWSATRNISRYKDGRLNVKSNQAKLYINQLKSEQGAFATAMRSIIPSAIVSTYINEHSQSVQNTYHIIFNGLVVDPGTVDIKKAMRDLQKISGVKRVYRDYAHKPSMYASLPLVNASAAWSNSAIGGQDKAGVGVKIASIDGGVHKDAAMFDGAGYSYPPGFSNGGLGFTSNNNGKIIASRTYFRSYDPPAEGDENPWPGENGTSHGVHTAGTAGGNQVTAEYLGINETISGVAPKAWIMSYRVFYYSINEDDSAYDAELIAATEDAVADGADVINNSWGGGPCGAGGEFDALDQALINAVSAGVFISMSAGNSGPGKGTADHPSGEYICVAASSTDGTFAAGWLNITAPEPVPDSLQGINYAAAGFGTLLETGQSQAYSGAFTTAMSVDESNFEGCDPWPEETFTGKTAMISRGSCEYGTKVLFAENAGAEFVIIYNHEDGGDTLISMGAGGDGDQVTIPSIFIGHSDGLALVDWHANAAAQGEAALLEVNTLAYQAGNTPDVIAEFSSRGPGVGNTLKPDITAPGVNILSQGFTPGASGEDRHLGYGQASGTSMSAPHIAGAAALLLHIHPDWSPAYIKSALMTTSRYLEIYTHDGSPAQPLDMGAGRLDLTNVADPGVVLAPPSVSFGAVSLGSVSSSTVTVSSVANQTETYAISTVYTGNGFDTTTAMSGITVTPDSITLEQGQSATITVLFDSSQGLGTGDNQGYLIMEGAKHHAHMPVWARVLPPPASVDVLIIDNDGSVNLDTTDYLDTYTQALDELGLTYEVYDADANYGTDPTIPDAATLLAYKTILYFTGDNYYPDGSFTVSTPLTELDKNALTEYANNGGTIIAMGQDLSWVLDYGPSGPFFYVYILGGDRLQDSISGENLPNLPIIAVSDVPSAFKGIYLDVSGNGDGAANQFWIDELKSPSFYDEVIINAYTPLLKYPGDSNIEDGIVAIAHRDQPTLERSGVSYSGRSIYTSFGLEGVNDDLGGTTRAGLLQSLLNWAQDEPVATINNVTTENSSSLMSFNASLSSNIPGTTAVSHRWDTGDGSDYAGPFSSEHLGHSYEENGTYTVRVEVIDSWGNRAIGTLDVEVTNAPESTTSGSKGKDGLCFIATAAYGSPINTYVNVLREFRNRFLLTTSVGKAFVDLYYTCSPPVAEFIANHETLRVVVRWSLLPVVFMGWMAINLGPVLTLAFVLLFLSLISSTMLVLFRRIHQRDNRT